MDLCGLQKALRYELTADLRSQAVEGTVGLLVVHKGCGRFTILQLAPAPRMTTIKYFCSVCDAFLKTANKMGYKGIFNDCDRNHNREHEMKAKNQSFGPGEPRSLPSAKQILEGCEGL